MKLICTLEPRSNDTVTYTEVKGGKPGVTYTFARDPESGELVCDVPDEALVGRLLLTENFQPLDEADYPAAEALMSAAQPKSARRKQAELDDDDDALASGGGLPVESNTPPVSKKSPQARMGRGGRARRASLGA